MALNMAGAGFLAKISFEKVVTLKHCSMPRPSMMVLRTVPGVRPVFDINPIRMPMSCTSWRASFAPGSRTGL